MLLWPCDRHGLQKCSSSKFMAYNTDDEKGEVKLYGQKGTSLLSNDLKIFSGK